VQFAGGSITGRLGCNRFSGAYQAHRGFMVVPSVAATRMACGEPQMSHENLSFAVLGQPMRMGWSHSGSRLTLYNGAGAITLSKLR